MNYRSDRFRSRSSREYAQPSPTDRKTVEGYSEESLSGAIKDLSETVAAGRSGKWERKRLAALEAERDRRKRHRRGSEVTP